MGQVRDVRTNPQPGDVIHHPKFGGGCSFTVRTLIPHRAWGEALIVDLLFDDGHRPRRSSARVWSVHQWPSFAKDCAVRRVSPDVKFWRAHNWQKVSKTIWHCPVCHGYIRSYRKPHEEAAPTKSAASLFQLMQCRGERL